MIRALMDGRKTQTRRIIKPRHRASLFSGEWADEYVLSDENADWRNQEIKYAAGDRLWVRETWAKTSIAPIVETIESPWFVYRECDSRCDFGGPWKPSIFMPRAASRLTLTVTDVRVQRLQDISNTEARAEGAVDEEWDQWREDVMNVAPGGSKIESERDSFSCIWDSLNEKRGYGWDANPWVVALTFKVIKENIDRVAA